MPLYAPSGPPMPVAGQYAYLSSPGAIATSAALGVGVLRLAPWLVTRPFALDRIGAEVTTIGDVGSLLRLGVYADNGSAYPGVLLLDAGTIAGDSATVQQITASLALAPGLYWVGGAVQSVTTTQPTVRIASGWTPPVALTGGNVLPSGGQGAVSYQQASVTGALPASFQLNPVASASVARILVRAA